MESDQQTVLSYQSPGELRPQPLPGRLFFCMVLSVILTLVGAFSWSAHEVSWFEARDSDAFPLAYGPSTSVQWCVEYPFLAGTILLFAILVVGLLAMCSKPPGRGRWKHICFVLLIPMVGGVILLLVMFAIDRNVFSG